jgi:hypothetical protein
VYHNIHINCFIILFADEDMLCHILIFLQLLDLPGIIEGAKDGKGRGKQVIAGKICGHNINASLRTFILRHLPLLLIGRHGSVKI